MWEKKLRLVLVLVACCVGKGFARANLFHPPVLIGIDTTYIDVPSNSTLYINCEGKYPLSWRLHEFKKENDSRLVITSSVNMSQPVNKHRSTLSLEDLDFNDTGFYSCYYDGTTDFSSADNVTSVYVFVNDPQRLFVDNSNIMLGHLLIPVQQHKKGVIPCLPTSSGTNVTLWKTENEEDFVMVSLGSDVVFDPTRGFILHYPTFYFSGSFQCRARNNGTYEDINITLLYMPDTYHDPQPFIDMSDAQHPMVNGTFSLRCTVNVDPGTRLFMEWSYPNKNDSGLRINETSPFSQWRTRSSYIHQEITRYLVVRDAQPSDSGRYICSVTDHSEKTGRAEVNIVVYASQQPVQVNFTTDVNTSEPVVYQAGQSVRFVITVHAFPSIDDVQLHWERNGEALDDDDSRYRTRVLASSVVLEIHQLHRSDAGTYTLVGRTKDGENSISILLEVKDKPIVTVKDLEIIYLKDQEYTLECHADAYPPPVVWWRWKPCKEVQNCKAGSLQYGWMDVEHQGESPNHENVTLEFSDVKTISLVSQLHLTAVQSGHYMCAASNSMGKDDVTFPFIVTDAADGFEITVSNRKPIDKDYVELACKANAYNFTKVEWKWRPMHTAGNLLSVENLTDVTIESKNSVYSLSEVIVFDPMHKNMSGEYECIASGEKNMTLTKHITIDVKAIKKPVLVKTNLEGASVPAAPGTLQEFFCYADGVPFPDVIWKKDRVLFDVTNMSGVELTERDQKLTIRRVLGKDAGLYECVVQNRGGFVVANATLDILADSKEDMDKLTVEATVIVIVFVLLGLVLIVVASFLICRILKDKKKKKELDFMKHGIFERGYIDIFNPNLPIEDQIDLLPYKNHWEFPRERLKLGKTLGQGAFGRVVKAEAIGLVEGEASTTVAVKMLKESADNEQRKALIAELKILIHIGKHLNIVNLLGAVTKNMAKGELYVIVEYCCYGNLRHFLLKHKGTFIDQLDHRTGQLNTHMSTLPGSPFSNVQENMVVYSNMLGLGLDNPSYKSQSLHYADIAHDQVTDSGTGISVATVPSGSSVNEQNTTNSSPAPAPAVGADCCAEEPGQNPWITTCDLLCFAFQCARGMEYLASRKLIHRDLAARNVLLAKDNIVKICDFGLAKDCYKYSNYVKKSDGLLPVKWMAIESIRDKVFTTKSDVWSFGILLWEIFTLGSNPYPGIEINEEFYKKLKHGYRMERPDLAPDIIYNLMKKCWLDEPTQRPDFTDLAESIGTLLESGVRKYYVELNTPYQVMNDELLNNNDYLQMTGEEYTNMAEPKRDADALDQLKMYNNIVPALPISNGPVHSGIMEIVPMIQLESVPETWTRPREDNDRLEPILCETWTRTEDSDQLEPSLSETLTRAQNDNSQLGSLPGKWTRNDQESDIISPSDDYDSKNGTEISYLTMSTSPLEKYDLDEYDSVFLEQKTPYKASYVNGYLKTMEENEICTRC